MHEPWPDSLLVQSEMDALVVTLGPSRGVVARGGLAVAAGATVTGGALALVGLPILSGLVLAAGCALGAAARVRGWVRVEAPLEVWLRPHELELRRVFRGRTLHAERLRYTELRRCHATPDRVVLATRDGRERVLVAGFRTPEELAWVARAISERMRADGNASGVDPRLAEITARPHSDAVRNQSR